MHIISILMTVVGAAFLALAGLLVHEALAGATGHAPAGVLRTALDRLTSMTVIDFDRDAVFGVAMPVILFLLLPGAALLNALLGGSPFMLTCYLLIVGSIFVHMLLAERTAAAGVRAILAGTGAVLALAVLPYYAVWSLTLHIVNGSPAEGALIGLLIATVLYAANAGVWTLMHTGVGAAGNGGGHRFTAAMLASLPVGYVLYWFVLLATDMSGLDSAGLRGWGTLAGFSAGFAACAAVFKAVLDAGCAADHGKFTPAVASAGLGILAILAGFTID